MYFVNPDYIAQVFLESQPRRPKNTRRAGQVKAPRSTSTSALPKSSHSRLWSAVSFRRAFG